MRSIEDDDADDYDLMEKERPNVSSFGRSRILPSLGQRMTVGRVSRRSILRRVTLSDLDVALLETPTPFFKSGSKTSLSTRTAVKGSGPL